MSNPYRDDIGRFTNKSGNRSGRSADEQSREIASRWSSMTTDQQKVERRRIISAINADNTEPPRTSKRSVDDQSREIASRWSSMTADQQKVERRRILSNLGGSYGEGAAEKAQFGYSLKPDYRKPPTAASKRRRPTESWLVDPGRNTATSTGGSVIANVDRVNNAALKGLYGAEGSSRFQEVFNKTDENTRNAWQLGYRNPRAPRRLRVDE